MEPNNQNGESYKSIPSDSPESTRRIGLLLGAGGIRGCAHAGVLPVLEEFGYEADVVVGASIGSLFGAAYAAGWDSARIKAMTEMAPGRAVAELYLNRLRLDNSTYIGRLACELGENTQIEDLPRSFTCMALDCATGQVVALRKGPLLRSIEASIALPGFAKPVTIGSATYIDGGLRGPVPAIVAREAGAEFVIRIELSGMHAVRAKLRRRYSSLVAGLLSRSLRSSDYPHFLEKSAKTHELLRQEGMDADLVIVPEFYGLFCNSPVGIRFCARQGERATRRRLAALSMPGRGPASAAGTSEVVAL
jgi:predicted acylesterase/phospholipase RssA